MISADDTLNVCSRLKKLITKDHAAIAAITATDEAPATKNAKTANGTRNTNMQKDAMQRAFSTQ